VENGKVTWLVFGPSVQRVRELADVADEPTSPPA
jgi:hypothetical protein